MKALLVVLAAASARHGIAQGGPVPLPPDFAHRVAVHMDTLAKAGRFSGSVLIWLDGKTLLRKSYGYADWPSKRLMTPDTPVPLFSLSKSFTAGAVLLLQDRGLLKVEDPASKYLTDLPAAWHDITIHQLLTHTSGIGDEDTIAWYKKAIGPSISAFSTGTPNKPAKPGEHYLYSNAGYMILAKLVEKVSGKPIERFVEEEIFAPLHMTGAGDGGHSEGKRDVARGHTVYGGRMTPLDQRLTIIPGAGSLHANVDDLLKWRLAIDGGELFSKESREALHRPWVKIDEETYYGYGWIYHSEWPMWEHTGGGASCQTSLAWLPDRKMVIVVLKNSDSSAGLLPAWDLAGIAYSKQVAMPHLLDLDTFDRLQGVYRGSHGEEIVARIENDRLYVRLPGKASQPLEYAGGRKLQGGGTVAEFLKRPDGLFDLKLTLNGKTVLPATRIPPSHLGDYVGRYGNGGDQTSVERRGRWLVTAFMQPDMSPDPFLLTFLPAGNDRFYIAGIGAEVRFERDRTGRVVRLKTLAKGQVLGTLPRVPAPK